VESVVCRIKVYLKDLKGFEPKICNCYSRKCVLTSLVTHTGQCALDDTAILTLYFQGLYNFYLGDFFFLM
jgi:hypothetical protein